MPSFAPQGIFDCRAVVDYDSVAMSFCAHGTSPSVIVISTSAECVRSLDVDPQVCTFDYDGQQARFPDCIIDQTSVEFTEAGSKVLIRLFDHRWRWQNSARPITLSANRKIGTGSSIDGGSAMSAREIALRLLDSAGEARRNVDNVPDDDYPEVEIDGTNPPMIELEGLVGRYGLRICYDPTTGIVGIVRPGIGNPLPDDPAFAAIPCNPPEFPDRIFIVGSEVVFQCRLPLEAVAKEKSGQYVPLSRASYTPSAGWSSTWPSAIVPRLEAEGADEDTVRAAEESVYRAYRVTVGGFFDGTLWLRQFSDQNGDPIEVRSIFQILPIRSSLIDIEVHYDGTETAKPARLYGRWQHERPDPRPSRRGYVDPTLYPGSFSVIEDKGVVTLSEPTYLTSDGKIFPAVLELLCTFSVRVAANQMPLRASWEAQLSNRGTGYRAFSRPTLKRSIKFEDGATIDDPNFASVGRRLAAEIAAGFVVQSGAVAIYNEIVTPRPDGALQQYDYRVGIDGATTQISRNTEASVAAPRYGERVRRSRQIAEGNR